MGFSSTILWENLNEVFGQPIRILALGQKVMVVVAVALSWRTFAYWYDTYFKIKNSGPLAVIVITNIRATEKHTAELSCMYFFKCFIFIWTTSNSKVIKKKHTGKALLLLSPSN